MIQTEKKKHPQILIVNFRNAKVPVVKKMRIARRSAQKTLMKDLDITSSRKDKCFELKETDVDSILEVVKIIDNTKEDDLAKLEKEAIALLCGAVKEIEHEILEDRIDDFNRQAARRFLGWVTEQTYALALFENAEDNQGAPMFRELLQQASGQEGG